MKRLTIAGFADGEIADLGQLNEIFLTLPIRKIIHREIAGPRVCVGISRLQFDETVRTSGR
jgi:hypothetical protein